MTGGSAPRCRRHNGDGQIPPPVAERSNLQLAGSTHHAQDGSELLSNVSSGELNSVGSY